MFDDCQAGWGSVTPLSGQGPRSGGVWEGYRHRGTLYTMILGGGALLPPGQQRDCPHVPDDHGKHGTARASPEAQLPALFWRPCQTRAPQQGQPCCTQPMHGKTSFRG